jgi:cytosine/adenosine deaminase-related metal-dependent hydrolase
MHPGMIEDPQASFDEALAMHERWQGAANGRIHVWFGPRPPDATSTELYLKMMAAAREHGMHVTIHLAEANDRAEYTRKHYGMSTIEYAESVGMVGSDVLAVHAVCIDDNEIAMLARTGTHVSHNPVSNAKLGSGIAPVPEMLQAGVNVGLGTDGAPASNDYDMFRAMRWASYIHKVRLCDPAVAPCEQVLEMATINGARAMGLQGQIGSLEVGKKADFVVVDMNKPHLTPAFDPVSTIVCAATGKDVTTVVIDGRALVRDGQALSMDEERILAEARARAASLYTRAGVDLTPRWTMV